MNERHVVGREFVIASCDVPAMLDLVEDPLDARPFSRSQKGWRGNIFLGHACDKG
jgi:hypothetical protein